MAAVLKMDIFGKITFLIWNKILLCSMREWKSLDSASFVITLTFTQSSFLVQKNYRALIVVLSFCKYNDDWDNIPSC